MKKIFLIPIITAISFSNFLNKNFIAKIYERHNKQLKEYILKYDQNKIEVEVVLPTLNKGEIYTYTNGKKYIYYPKLNQTVEQSISNSTNDIFKLLDEMRKIKKTTKIGDKQYTVVKGNISKIQSMSYNVNIKYINNMPDIITVSNGKDKVEFIWRY